MIATLFIIFAFIRAFPWSRRRTYSDQPTETATNDAGAASNGPPPFNPANQYEQFIVPKVTNQELLHTTSIISSTPTTSTNVITSTSSQGSSDSIPRKASCSYSSSRRKSSKTIKAHEVTFSGSVGGGESDSERTPTSVRTSRLVRQPRSFTGTATSPSRAISPDTNSSSNYYCSSSQLTRASSEYDTATSEIYTARSKPLSERDSHDSYSIERSSSNGFLKRADTLMNSDEEEVAQERLRGAGADADNEAEADDSYDRDTEEFYSNIQDAAGTSGTRSKRSSLFSRSDSSATTTSSSGGTFTCGKRRSTASIISTSMCSDIIPIDRRRSSTTTEYSVRSVSSQPRRFSGRIRRHISRMTIAGARRRTTGSKSCVRYYLEQNDPCRSRVIDARGY